MTQIMNLRKLAATIQGNLLLRAFLHRARSVAEYKLQSIAAEPSCEGQQELYGALKAVARPPHGCGWNGAIGLVPTSNSMW